MKLSKQDILNALETISVPGEGGNMVETGAVKNVMTFGDEVIVDITITNPSLQAKKRTEVDILKTIHELVYEKAKITVNVKVEASVQPKNEIKGNIKETQIRHTETNSVSSTSLPKINLRTCRLHRTQACGCGYW